MAAGHWSGGDAYEPSASVATRAGNFWAGVAGWQPAIPEKDLSLVQSERDPACGLAGAGGALRGAAGIGSGHAVGLVPGPDRRTVAGVRTGIGVYPARRRAWLRDDRAALGLGAGGAGAHRATGKVSTDWATDHGADRAD